MARAVRVKVAAGAIEGERGPAGGLAFRGVPYARPPVGALRFSRPRPLEGWKGLRRCTGQHPMSLQPGGDVTTIIPGDPREQSEDCLYLNVFAPEGAGGSLPVMVFLHGGGFTGGTASSLLYEGEHLASHGVVVVTVNYRLGALGWLCHPALADPSDPGAATCNFGLHDQLLALEWVQENVAAFGGDPSNVTLFGESAGAMCVVALLATTAAGRLFQRAVVQSGAAAALGTEPATAVAEELAGELGIGSISRQALLRVPAEELLRAQVAVTRRHEVATLTFQPVVDGSLLSGHPAVRIAAGSTAGVDILIGTNRDEWRLWTWSSPALAQLDEPGLEELVRRQVAAAGLSETVDPGEVVEVYRSARAARGEASSPLDLYCAIASDWAFRVPSARLASAAVRSGSRVYSYLFDWESPFAGGALGSCHALELPFVFGTVANPFVALFSGTGGPVDRLSLGMRSAWTCFAASGSPACEEAGDWPCYEASGSRATKRLGSRLEVLEAPMERERAYLDDAFGPYGKLEEHLAWRRRERRAGS